MPVFADRPELLRAFRAGDTAALETVYWAYVDDVARLVVRAAAPAADARGVSAHDRADLIQETFSRAFAERARLGFDGLRAYRPYLLTISRNLIADWARRRGRELPVETIGDDLAAAPAEPDDAANVSPGELAVVERYLAGLDATLAGVYRERYISGCSQEECARTLGLSRQRVRTLEEKLRQGLRRALAKDNQL